MKKIPKLLKQSEILKNLDLWRKKIPSTNGYRKLNSEEKNSLENQGNSCENWNDIDVAQDFTASRIKNCFFSGKSKLPSFFGSVRTPEGLSVPTGIYDSFLNDCILENCHIYRVSTLAKTIVEAGAVIRNTGSIISSGATRFGNGISLNIGSEVGGRNILSYTEVDLPTAELILLSQKDTDLQKDFKHSIEAFALELESSISIICKGAKICNTTTLRNVWIGPESVIDGATKIQNTSVYSSLEQPTKISDGAIVKHSILQWGTKVTSHASVINSILLEASSATKQAKINHSIIAPNSHIMQGEVTSSLLGPFVGFHHQALLISALWPEGMGNVGHGANVGSNHTGRLPDQEIRPGLGTFFGLGSNIKYPADYSDAPWSLIATGITTLPQKVEFPFSLITQASHYNSSKLQSLNQILPAWMLGNCAFTLARNEWKFNSRNKARRQDFSYSMLDKRTAQLVLKAYQRLNNIKEIKEFYTVAEIPGLGKNFITESVRQKAQGFYKEYLERFALNHAVDSMIKYPSWIASKKPILKKLFAGELLREICKIVMIPAQLPLIIKHYRQIEKHWHKKILDSLEKDYERGQEIFDDYLETHPKKETTVDFALASFEESKGKTKTLMLLLKASSA